MKKNSNSSSWRIIFSILLGAIFGILIFTLYISKASSYLSDEPETCVNCHIMAPQYATWNHSSHREVANCNDCHVPHDNVLNKYFFKAKDGINHAYVFSMRNEPQVITIKEESKEVVHQNCIRCHTERLNDPKLALMVDNHKEKMEARVCWECHQEVPHGRVKSLASTPNARIPLLKSPVPNWLNNLMN